MPRNDAIPRCSCFCGSSFISDFAGYPLLHDTRADHALFRDGGPTGGPVFLLRLAGHDHLQAMRRTALLLSRLPEERLEAGPS